MNRTSEMEHILICLKEHIALSDDEDNLLLDYITNLQQENKQLKDNWNKLKEYIKTEIPEDAFIDTEWFVSILDKMQELEQGSDNNDRPKTR